MANKVLSALGFIGFILMIVLPLVYYPNLPDRIPTHYGFNGVPDNFGAKNGIWILTGIGAILYIGLKLLGMNIHRFKYNQDELSAGQSIFYRQYTRQTLEIVNLISVSAFAYINYATIQVAFGTQQGLGLWFLPLLLLLVTGLVAYTLINARKLKKME
ncbi:MAG: DUF1648 domain-containing protein [Cyclobacteriaceae bacterium]|nr:DUF1648 domain-containing protein [Cyclobacteriaceae bacterium SS2]